jgi:multicomponent K+:H+ antiporter subunit A
MPWTSVLAITAAAAMAGVPLLNGFLSKEMFFAETLEVGDRCWPGWCPRRRGAGGPVRRGVFLRFIRHLLHGEPVGLDRTPHEPPLWMRIPVELLVLVCLGWADAHADLRPAARGGGAGGDRRADARREHRPVARQPAPG